MQNLINDTPTPKKNYDFVDAIRAIAMMAIVMEHSIYFSESVYHPSNPVHYYIYATMFQFTKFGTINFFLLAGFLIGEKFTDYSPLQYLKRRIENTVKPWIFWSLFYLVLHIIAAIIVVYRFNKGVFDQDFTDKIADQTKTIYLYTNYWFIPNFLCCITILLIFKKYLYSYWLGFVLLVFSLIYSVNIYYTWIEPEHTTAILGFVFFLWLGAQFNQNFTSINNWISKTSVYIWLGLMIITLFLAVKEGLLLRQNHSIDAYNSLRVTNILYSVTVFFLLLKIKNFEFINFLKPRETTYGIYLIHYIIVDSVLSEIFRPLKFNVTPLPLAELIAYQLLRFVLVYGITFGLVKILNHTKLKWTIGR
ncbi:MAG: acyltransferase [Sphingobacteriaceae bacterium]|nr:MAG: acyltransferase [Sphingobacteriaceae bacterium]